MKNKPKAAAKKIVVESGEGLAKSCEFNGYALLRGAASIFYKEFFSFLRVNVILTVSFLVTLFLLFLYAEGYIQNINLGKYYNILKIFGFNDLMPVIEIILFWIFFSWLRTSYLAAANNFFNSEKNKKNTLLLGLQRIISFMLIESLRAVVFLVGCFFFVILPALQARYFSASAITICQNEGGINAMFESKEYTEGRLMATMRSMIFINLYIIATVVSCILITNFFIKDSLIFVAVNFFLFSFLFLPLHACYRVLLFKKLQFLDGELRFSATMFEKLFLVLWYVGILAMIVLIILSPQFSGVLDRVIFTVRDLVN